MAALRQLIADNWLPIVFVAVALTILIVVLWRNYDIEEITPTPPFVKLKRKTKSAEPAAPSTLPSVNISRNRLFGKTRIDVRREQTNISDVLAAGDTEIQVGAKPGPKPKSPKGKQRK